jgi:hypothetical protein
MAAAKKINPKHIDAMMAAMQTILREKAGAADVTKARHEFLMAHGVIYRLRGIMEHHVQPSKRKVNISKAQIETFVNQYGTFRNALRSLMFFINDVEARTEEYEFMLQMFPRTV